MRLLFASLLVQLYAVAAFGQTLVVTPKKALLDAPISIKVTGLKPGQAIDLRAQLQGPRPWSSSARFLANAKGVVDVAELAPQWGTYAGVSASGLFWSMYPADDGSQSVPAPLELSRTVEVAAYLGEQLLGRETIVQTLGGEVTTRTPVEHSRLRGVLFKPVGAGPFPAVIELQGSGGGISEARSRLLAAHGFAVLALAYFAYEDLPRTLDSIPLEYFETAITWLSGQPGIQANQMAVVGYSRGAELALLLGSRFPQLRAVVGRSPSGFIWSSLGSNPPHSGPAWTWQGLPLPYLKDQRGGVPAGQLVARTPSFLRSLQDQATVEARIPVEKINGPILLLSGQDDELWPSSLLSEMIVQSLKERRHAFPVEHLSYPAVGHLWTLPNAPSFFVPRPNTNSGFLLMFGGARRETALASQDSWFKTIAFLRSALSQIKN
ncbi:MAG: acyl-CoA thioesterase/bile acid-CoA:amino acid N-acyltransferase family protein [Acidobacteria bacterium]|nr:acyl-CoA thioesterase/bile acid-CoA:amino acid N-acyltransferase family protein [Acidobacteriota bacterium]